MSNERTNKNTAGDNIDLLVLVEKSLVFFRRYKWIFIAAILLGTAFGIYMYSTLSKIYQSRMVAHSFILTNQEHIQIVNNWNRLLKNHEFDAMAKIFNCDKKKLYPIKRIRASELQQVFSATNPHGFLIEVNITDNSILPDLQNGIVHGFENSEYVKQRLDVKKANLRELINKTEEEIKKLEATKTKMEDIVSGTERAQSPMIIGGSDVNRQFIEMNERLLGYKQDLKFANAIQVLQGFNAFSKPIGPKLIPWLFIGLVFFLGLAWVIVLYHYISKKIKARSIQTNVT